MKTKRKPLIFDFYGTLAQVTVPLKPYLKIWNAISNKKISKSQYQEIVMTGKYASIQAVVDGLGLDKSLGQKLTTEIETEVNSVELYKEVPEILESLSKTCEIYLLSNLAPEYGEPFLKLGLDKWITRPFFSYEMGSLKPSRDAFQYVLKEIGRKPDEVIMIGDSYKSDVMGAQASDIKAIWLRRNGRTGEKYIKSLRELDKRIGKETN